MRYDYTKCKKSPHSSFGIEGFFHFHYLKLPGTDFEILPEFVACCGETAGFNIRIFINSFQ